MLIYEEGNEIGAIATEMYLGKCQIMVTMWKFQCFCVIKKDISVTLGCEMKRDYSGCMSWVLYIVLHECICVCMFIYIYMIFIIKTNAERWKGN